MSSDPIVAEELFKRARKSSKLLEAHFEHPSREHFTFPNERCVTTFRRLSELREQH